MYDYFLITAFSFGKFISGITLGFRILKIDVGKWLLNHICLIGISSFSLCRIFLDFAIMYQYTVFTFFQSVPLTVVFSFSGQICTCRSKRAFSVTFHEIIQVTFSQVVP